MGSLGKEMIISLVLHVGLLVLVLSVTANNVKLTSPAIVDLTLNDYPAREYHAPKKPGQQVVTSRQSDFPPPRPTHKDQVTPAPQPVIVPVLGQQAIPKHDIAPPDTEVTEFVQHKIIAESATSKTYAVYHPGQHIEGEITQEKARQKYLKEHFTYIRDLVIKRLSYPAVARRMGWNGRVVLAFVVAEDGNIHSLQIRSSSGYQILDTCALDTVKIAAPFPRPPVAAEIVMPVNFRLQ
jgi:protein TonB